MWIGCFYSYFVGGGLLPFLVLLRLNKRDLRNQLG